VAFRRVSERASQLGTMLHQDIISCMHRTIDPLVCNFKSLLYGVLFRNLFLRLMMCAVISPRLRVHPRSEGDLEFQQNVHPAQSNVACENRQAGLISSLDQHLGCKTRKKQKTIRSDRPFKYSNRDPHPAMIATPKSSRHAIKFARISKSQYSLGIVFVRKLCSETVVVRATSNVLGIVECSI